MRKLAFIMLALFATIITHAQSTSTISGTVLDGSKKGVSSATVSLMRAKDSTLVRSAVTDNKGNYVFEKVGQGEFFVSISSIGFERSKSPVIKAGDSGSVVIPTVTLEELSKAMTGVVVTAKKPFIETKLDKTIVNVESSPTSAGATALEILEKSPGISVDNDGNISLRGKAGVIIMLDGKPSYLSAADLANMLKNMPASQLEQIEIMTNPSAKFDAAGNSGVINIKTKKGKAAGFNGSFSVSYTTSIYKPKQALYFYPKAQNSFNFNWKKNKINVFGSYNPNIFRGGNTLQFENVFLNNNLDVTGYNNTETRFKFGNNNHSLKLGMDWYANKKNTFGIVLNGFDFRGHPTPSTVGNLTDANRVLQSRLVSKTTNDNKFRNGSVNLNWKHTFDSTGRELTADIDYVVYASVSDLLLNTYYYNGNLQQTGSSALRGHLPSGIDIVTFKTDYTHPFKGGRVEAGMKFSYVKNDNEVNYQNLRNGKWEDDLVRSNHFIYDENINAAYVNYGRELKKFSMQLGLRLENTIAHGKQLGNASQGASRFKRDTTNLFPTAFISYKADAKNTFSINYGRRINRPNYQDLNPFTFFLDSLSYRQGNVYLKPQYTHNIELSHAFKGKFITTLNYSATDNVISQVNKLDPNNPDSRIRLATIDNVSKFRNIGLAITTPFKIAKWWNVNLSTNIFNNQYKGKFDTINIDLGFTSFMMNMTSTLNLGKGYTGEVSAFYRHKSVNNLTRMEPIYQLGFGLQKQVLKGKGTLRFNARDPFAWQKFRGETKYGRIEGSFLSRPDVRQVTLSFSYRFGKQSQSAPKRNNASQDEQNRIGGAN